MRILRAATWFLLGGFSVMAAMSGPERVIKCLKSHSAPLGEVKGDLVLSGDGLNLFVGDQFSFGNNGSVAWLSRNASHAGAWVLRGRILGENRLPNSYKGFSIATSFNGKHVVYSGSSFRDDTVGSAPLRGELWIFTRNDESATYEQNRYIYEAESGLGSGVAMNSAGTLIVTTTLNSIVTFQRKGNTWTRLANSPLKSIGYGDRFFLMRGGWVFTEYELGLTALKRKRGRWVVDPLMSTKGVLNLRSVFDISGDASLIAYADDDYSEDHTDYFLSMKCRTSAKGPWRRCDNHNPLDPDFYHGMEGFPSHWDTMKFSRNAKNLIARNYFESSVQGVRWIHYPTFHSQSAARADGFIPNPELYFRDDFKATKDSVVTVTNPLNVVQTFSGEISTLDCILVLA